MKEVDYILDMKVEKIKEKIKILQKAYTTWMLEKFGMSECKSQTILLPVRISISATNGSKI